MDPSTAPSGQARISTAAILMVIAGAALWTVFDLEWCRHLASGALLVYLAIEAPRITGGGRRMLLAGLVAAIIAAVAHPAPLVLLSHALDEAAFVAGLFSSLGMLRDTAQSSALVQRCGEQMVRQPPSRRFVVLALGSHMISLVLNFGVLPLLGTMIVRGNTLEAAGGDTEIQSIRKRRMMSAILQGFALMTVWSPLSIAFAVTQVVMHGLPWWHLLVVQLILACLLMTLAWGLDRRAFPPRALRPPPAEGDDDWKPVLELGLLVAAVVAGAVTIAAILKVRLVVGAMLVVPPAAVLWMVVQQPVLRPSSILSACHGFGLRLTHSLPAFRYEVAMLGGAMFLGTVIAAFVSPEQTAALIARLPLPPILLVILLTWSVMAMARFGISQIISVTLLGSALGNLSQAGIHPLVLASGMMGAWALSACSTTVGAAVMTVARMAEVPVGEACDWSRTFVRAGAVLLALWMILLSVVL